MAPKPIVGLHHVTAIARDPQRNLDFYTGVLGLRFVKKTINFDDPGTYHFYFGDDVGTPGTIITFFPWPHATRGTVGAGEVTHTAFSIPPSSIDYWEGRLAAAKVPVERIEKRLGETVLTFKDPDGMGIELVGHAEPAELKVPRFADVPAEHAIRGFFGVTMLQRAKTGTEAALALLGFRLVAEEGNRMRFSADGDALGNHLDVVIDPKAGRGRMGAGTVHHIAFRSADYEDQKEWLAKISQSLSSSPVMERDYFRSIYFREPGGVLFELATDIPGFAIDEPVESLGEQLCVPHWLEPHLAAMTNHLPAVTLHKAKDKAKEEVGVVSSDPHASGRVLHAGSEVKEASLAVVLLHGRGGSAEDILGLASAFDLPGIAYFAPQAAGHTWYPLSFMAQQEANEPYLSSALAKVDAVVRSIEQAGVKRNRIVVAGFSQGACLATEFVASHPARYGGLIAFTGGLIGPPGTLNPRPDHVTGKELAGTPALFSSGDPDPHVPWQRVEESAAILRSMGAAVTTKRYPGRPHTITAAELDAARLLLVAAQE